jgi:hypothetical protein
MGATGENSGGMKKKNLPDRLEIIVGCKAGKIECFILLLFFYLLLFYVLTWITK